MKHNILRLTTHVLKIYNHLKTINRLIDRLQYDKIFWNTLYTRFLSLAYRKRVVLLN